VTEVNADETEIKEKTDKLSQGYQGHPPGKPQAIFSGRKYLDRAKWIA
jgi:hypothetical protein